MSRSLPTHPSLESLRKQAKELLRQQRAGLRGLRDAQLALAREYGFAGWADLCDEVELRRARALPLAARAAEFADLACLTYGPEESPRRIERARRLLAADPRLVDASGYAAAAAGDVAALERWLAGDPERARLRGGPRSWSPLFYVTYSRIPDGPPARSAVACVRLLLEHGADPNEPSPFPPPYRFTALTGAIGEGEQGLELQPPHAHAHVLAELLLDAGARPDEEQGLYNSQFTPDDGWLELLLARGLTRAHTLRWDASRDISLLDYQLSQAVKRGFRERVELLLRHGADPNAIDPYNGRSALRNALRERQPALHARLLAAGARPEEPELEDRIYCAVRADDGAVVRELAAAHPELLANARLLFDAAGQGALSVIRALLDAGADVHARVLGGALPLHAVSRHGRIEVAALLLERGAAVAAREDVYDSTPIGWAHHGGKLELREYLLDRTDDVFDLATWGRLEQLERVLGGNPALATARRARGLTPLHRLDPESERTAPVIDLLLACGAGVNDPADDGSTPLDVCESQLLDDLAELLRERGGKPGRHAGLTRPGAM